MCGRYMLTSPVEALRQLFLFEQRPNLPPRFNIAPTQDVPIVRWNRERARELALVRWGLVPFWAKDVKIGARMINARAETVATLPAFREAYRRRRCLIPADGISEWRKVGKARQPFLIKRRDGAPFALAGLWERWRVPGEEASLHSCTIVTTSANELVAPLHDRMPVMLAPDDHENWLDPEADGRSLLRPCLAAWLEAYPVSPKINLMRNDDAGCIQPLDDTAARTPLVTANRLY